MALFGNKKKGKESLQPLSEKEIQAKLYGRVTPPETEDESPKIERKTAPLVSQPKISKPQSTEGTIHAPSGSKDLFSNREKSGAADSHLADREKRKEQERLARITEWADEEIETLDKAKKLGWYQEPVSKQAFDYKPKVSKWKPVLKAVLKVLADVVYVAVSGILSAVRFVRFRVLKSKRVLYWTGGLTFLLVLFLLIHFLNVQREAAMKMPRPRPVPVAPAEPQQSAEETAKPNADEGALTSATETVPPAEEPKEEASPQVTSDTHPFVIQIATFATQRDANRLKKNLEEANVDSFVRDLRSGSGKVYYSVFLGRFKDFREAQYELEKFRKKEVSHPFQDAFIRTLK